jgi:hypothetical protein
MSVLRQHAMSLACVACVLVIAAALLFGAWIVPAIFCGAMMLMMVGMAGGMAGKHRH